MGKEKTKKKAEGEGDAVAKKEDQTLKEVLAQQQQKMGEEEKKEKKTEEVKIDHKGKGKDENEGKPGAEEKKGEKPAPPPPSEVVVMRVLMHCEGCAKKVRRCIEGLEGVDDVRTDCKTNTVVVKGKKVAQDPKKLANKIYRKSRKRAEIISPVPVPVPVPVITPVIAIIETPYKKKEVETHKVENKKEARGVMVILKINMHCEGCSEAIKTRILKLREVHEVIVDLRASQVTVKGNFDPKSLVQYIYKHTGKKAVIVKQEPIFGAGSTPTNPKPDNDSKSKKAEEKEREKTEEKEIEESKDEEVVGPPMATVITVADPSTSTGTSGTTGRNEQFNYYHYPTYPVEYGYHYPAYAPQMFSDENPNACIVM